MCSCFERFCSFLGWLRDIVHSWADCICIAWNGCSASDVCPVDFSNSLEKNTTNPLDLCKIKVGLIYLSFHRYPVCFPTSVSLTVTGAHFTFFFSHINLIRALINLLWDWSLLFCCLFLYKISFVKLIHSR